eukprot:TRINITY_DN211_c0_g1_i1.p1 TRINITY_DN211_c0_g1~~TRINITY_DN211_c0_g1_i1.p1  ORF type:complete len:360 (+),score=68.47 TRINITY_DN211_c0_g1_i1:48-1127(+)
MPRHGVEDPFADPSSSIPYHSFAVDTTNQETVLSGIRYAAQTILPDWSSLSREEIEVELMSGGTTNLAVAKVSAKIKGQESIVVIRVFGINTELLIDRIAETKVIEILGNKSRISFQIYGRFANGRVEEFMPGKALVYTDLTCQLYPYIAAKVAAVHQLDVPISKEPAFWNVVEKWLKEASAKLVELDCPEKAAQLRSFNLPKIEEEINLIRRHIDQLAPPVTFGHNDLTPPNIIWDEETESIALVDYEYAGYNFRGFDIGNFFTEHAGLHCDWTLYPKEDARLIFITAYLSALGDEPTEDQIRSLHREACSFSLASHLYWGLWGIVQAKNSMVDFDYLAYSRGRFDGYWLMKDEFLAL